jgi:hypothetical protein
MPNSKELNPEARTNFLNQMRDKYQANFVIKLREAFRKTFGQDNEMSESQAREYFETFITGLYDKQIPGLSNGYGHYSEEVRQQMVEAFSLQTSALIQSLGDVAAQGCTFLWSNQNIGMFAAAEQAIREAAGVFSSGQSLEQTPLGRLWGELELLTNPDKAMGLTWDKTSQAWNAISKEFAANAEGEVHVFLPKDIGALTIFWNVELPELRKRMEPFMNPPKVTEITLHSPNQETLIKLLKIDKNETMTPDQKKQEKQKLMTESNNWDSKKIKDASIKVPMPEAQRKQIEQIIENTPNGKQSALLEILTEGNTIVKSITLNKLQNIGQRWRINTLFQKLENKQPASQEKIVKKIVQYLNKNPNILSRSRRPSSRPHQNSSRPPHKSLSN